jgi:hypothetical protein
MAESPSDSGEMCPRPAKKRLLADDLEFEEWPRTRGNDTDTTNEETRQDEPYYGRPPPPRPEVNWLEFM